MRGSIRHGESTTNSSASPTKPKFEILSCLWLRSLMPGAVSPCRRRVRREVCATGASGVTVGVSQREQRVRNEARIETQRLDYPLGAEEGAHIQPASRPES